MSENLTASDEVLMAAKTLAGDNLETEFSEWALTVAAWKLNANRWGLRGFEGQYPDHKRVMNEIMGSGSIVEEGWIERPRKNHYRLTQAGLLRLSQITASRDPRPRAPVVYDSISKFARHRVFEAYLQDPQEPKTWLGAASFLNLTKNDRATLERQMGELQTALREAAKYMDETGTDALQRGDAGKVITREHLQKLSEFTQMLETRFELQLQALRKKA